MQNDGPVVLDFYAEHLLNGGLVIEESPMLNADPLSLSGLLLQSVSLQDHLFCNS